MNEASSVSKNTFGAAMDNKEAHSGAGESYNRQENIPSNSNSANNRIEQLPIAAQRQTKKSEDLIKTVRNHHRFNNSEAESKHGQSNTNCYVPRNTNRNTISIFQIRSLSDKHPNEILLTILDKRSGVLSLLNESQVNKNYLPYLFIVLGKASCSDMPANVNNFIQAVNCNSRYILLHMQQYLVSLRTLGQLDENQLDPVHFLTIFLEKFQSIMPSSSSDFMSMLLPLLESTCENCLKAYEDLYISVSKKLKEINEQNQHFLKHHNAFEMRRASEKEKMHFKEPTDSFRSLPVLPTAEDVSLPCLFLRPNLVNGKYRDTEHYLDIQYRLLREDYVKPLRDGISEYLNIKKRGESLRNCKNVRVYSNVCIEGEDFINGDLWHCLKFSDKGFEKINWERSKRFLTKSLLCLTLDDFKTMLFASVIRRDPEELKKGLLYIRFEEITDEVLNLNSIMRFVVIETTAYFEAYRHNLMALLQLNEDTLPLKTYIIDVEKKVGRPQYLQATTTFDMRPLFLPLDEKYIIMSRSNAQYEYSVNVSSTAKCIKVLEDSSWPTAIDLNLDDSQYFALKEAITKEFSIIQGPPGTGKTYIGLRIVQLLLHNLDKWFTKETNSLPILVVCYTNHALDQFLEGLLLFTKKIVRIGGRSSNDKILEYQLQNLKKKAAANKLFPRHIFNNIRDTNAKLKCTKEEIDMVKYQIEKCKYVVLSELDLKAYMPPVHYETLINSYSRQRHQEKLSLYDWLGISLGSGKAVNKKSKNKLSLLKKDNPFETYGQFDSDDEADIEHIEDQRNIDFYDFEDFSFKKYSEIDSECVDVEDSEQSAEDTGWKTQESKKQRYEMNKNIKHCLEYYEAMTEEAAMQVKHVWHLDSENRWQLYKFWLQNFIKERFDQSFYLQGELKKTFQEVDEMRKEEDLFLMEKANIVGLTTNGAAKYRHLVQRLNPMILVVEEAAEILESHIVTSLAPNTKHVILIGDQQQLRPSPTVHMLAVKYDLNISLFERMVMNGVDYCRLSIQHRMRPEIAALLVPHIYSNLENHKVVTEFENIKGVDKSVFFLSHSFNESSESDSKSKVNEYEAKFLIQLCRYLLLQGYEPSQITVLTTYSGQLFALKNLATDEVKKIRFTVVDNFQGEENDIILISFVRSNDDGIIGFLKVPNRVCVALSRAKKALYCIGNFELLTEKSILWRNITETLNSNQSIGPLLRLICQNHPETHTDVSCEADFKNVPEGGCNRKCEYRLPCGHCCLLMCHLYDQEHKQMKCKKPCTKTCERGHHCEKKCFQECFCSVLIDRTLDRCGHTVKEICGIPENEIICSFNCEEILSCTHQCTNRCGEKCAICMNPCIKNCESGHKCEMKCSETCYCKVFVDKTLTKCGHVVKEWCGKPEEEISCPLKCQKVLNCTHQCSKKCGETCVKSCKEPCLKFCKNVHQCQKLCSEECGPCDVLVNKTLERCGHTVKDLCGKNDASILCSFKCEKLLRCKHRCFKKCGEDCETMCKEPCLKTCEEGHNCKKVCYKMCDCTVVVDKTLVNCGHTVKVICGKRKEETKCSFKCERKLICGHYCTNGCGEDCVETCIQLKETISPLCGHHIKVQCYITNSPENLLNKSREELFKICSEQCKEVLPCGHECSGTCGSCYQKRLHVPCNETCKRILICGHRCQSVCSKSCPPCQNPCENKCIHSKCRKKCGEPCRKCMERCDWSCNHKECTKLCNEICNREPCNESCLEILSCGHPCIGFCGEPCPKICRICDNKTKDSVFYNLEDDAKFVLLENCDHVFEVHGLNRWMIDVSEGSRKIRMKTCPACKTVIRNNLRYNNIVKEYIFQLERLKKINEFNKKKNQELKTVLLQKSVSLTSFSYFEPRNRLSKCLSSYSVQNIQELTKIENIICIFTGLKSLNFENISSEFPSIPQVLQMLIEFAHITSKWVTDFILEYFLTVSEHQLIQLIYEVHRLRLIGRLLQYAKPNFLESPEFENCSLCLMSYAPFYHDSQKAFTAAFQLLTSKFVGNIENISTPIEFPYLKTMDMSAGHWYKCSKGHAYCITQYVGNITNYCYECVKKTQEEQLLNRHKKSHKSSTGLGNKFSHYLSDSGWTGAESETINKLKGNARWNQQRENSSWNTESSISRHIPPETNYQRSLNRTSGKPFSSFSGRSHPVSNFKTKFERSYSKPSNYFDGIPDFGHLQSTGYYEKDVKKLQSNPFNASGETSANTHFSHFWPHRVSGFHRPPAVHINNFQRSYAGSSNATVGMSVNAVSGHSRSPSSYDNDLQRPHFRPSNLSAGTSYNSSSTTRSGHLRNMRQRLRGNSGFGRSRSNFKY